MDFPKKINVFVGEHAESAIAMKGLMRDVRLVCVCACVHTRTTRLARARDMTGCDAT